ncbi:cation/calcium exchanger 5 [Typha latifolia]|uniref:cation/calcium exchanger 5 n=1 Tax=Typha latifolia TaxID=4733 RepID=UPI003C2B0112
MASSSSSSSSLKLIYIALLLLSFLLFLLIFPPPPPLPSLLPNPSPNSRHLLQSSPSSPSSSASSLCSSILHHPISDRCAISASDCRNGLLNYFSIHFCLLSGNHLLSLPFLSLLLLLHFAFLAAAAGDHFSPVVSRLAATLRLSPSMAAVTLLALGNGAPDVFASAAALRSGQPRTGLAAILSAGAFVSAFVVGAVAIYAAPFPLSPAPFIRDVFFYLVAASALFYVYLSAEIFLWQAVGFVLFYLFFVGFVFYMDFVVEGKVEKEREKEKEVEMGMVVVMESKEVAGEGNETKSGERFCGWLGKITKVWEVPVSTILRLTIPSASPSDWNRFYISANISLCPLILLYSLSSFIALDSQIVFFLPQTRFPLWAVVLFVSICLATTHFWFEEEPPETEPIIISLISFMMSVFWISTMAGELMNCLAAIGTIMELPPAILGLTVLAWGNSVGDLVADVALAKAGQPAMAMAGCFAGPMFNMLVGLGTALVIQTTRVYPSAYVLQFNVSIVVAFVFLLLSLMASLLVMTWFRFRVPRFWGYCLVGLYLLFTAVSLALAGFLG